MKPIDNQLTGFHHQQTRLIKLNEVIGITGLSRATIYRFIQAGSFPPQVSLGARAVAWVEHEVQAWMASKILCRPQASSSGKNQVAS